ncbi:hypothetical protein EV142_104307 [Flavobacterium circumlabens]|uniref:Uncharacterized protein n=1 Tax=Flavobacterium circumlabens TaxID=2133765 RepID=A0ABY2B0Z1_9FLAO|nr:hypothetical protein EV142_104307 [Flavobacterium circumlabens]
MRKIWLAAALAPIRVKSYAPGVPAHRLERIAEKAPKKIILYTINNADHSKLNSGSNP